MVRECLGRGKMHVKRARNKAQAPALGDVDLPPCRTAQAEDKSLQSVWGSGPWLSTCKQQNVDFDYSTTNMAHPEASSRLTILSLAEPLLSADDSADRLSNKSLDAELEHYKDLFSKLRFSYVEQVTKERFLKAIVADPPQLVDAAENARLEQHLAHAKAALKAKKEQTNQKVRELQELAGRLAQCNVLPLDPKAATLTTILSS